MNTNCLQYEHEVPESARMNESKTCFIVLAKATKQFGINGLFISLMETFVYWLLLGPFWNENLRLGSPAWGSTSFYGEFVQTDNFCSVRRSLSSEFLVKWKEERGKRKRRRCPLCSRISRSTPLIFLGWSRLKLLGSPNCLGHVVSNKKVLTPRGCHASVWSFFGLFSFSYS